MENKITINGKEYLFQVGTFLHERYVEELTGASIVELYENMKKTPARSYTHLIYSGIQAGHRASKKELTLSLEDLEEILNEVELTDVLSQLNPDKKKANTTSS